jgi:hypothetical protein
MTKENPANESANRQPDPNTSRFEWKPEDVVILNEDDPEFDEDDDLDV